MGRIMEQKSIDSRSQISDILKVASMATAAPRVQPLNALDVQAKIGIPLHTLARAINADPEAVSADPRGETWQAGLRTMAELWSNLLVLFGSEEDARSFLRMRRPEFRNETALYYLEAGRPRVVLNLVLAMREMLP